MKIIKTTALVFCTAFFSTGVNAKLSQLIDIPSITLEKSTFANELVTICENVDAVGPQIRNLRGFSDSGFSQNAVKAWNQMDKQTGVTTAEDKALLASVASLSVVCKHLGAPVNLTDDDLAVLRSMREESREISNISANLSVINFAQFTTLDQVVNELKKTTAVGAPQAALGPLSPEAFAGIESKVINGLADFINSRAKAEAALYLQQQLRKELCDKTIHHKGVNFEVIRYFPNLCIALESDETYVSLNSIGIFLQSAAKRDLEKLPENLFVDLLQQSDDIRVKETLVSALLGYEIFKESKTGRTTSDIIHGIAEVGSLPCESDENAPCRGIKLARLISLVIRSIQEQDGYQQFSEMPVYYSVAILLALEKHLANKDKSSYLVDESFVEFNASQVREYLKFLNMVANIAARIEKTSQELRTKKSNDKQEIIRERVYLISYFLESTENIADQLILTKDPTAQSQWIDFDKVEEVKRYVATAKEMSDFGLALFDQNTIALAFTTIDVVARINAEYSDTNINNQIPPEISKALPLVIEIASAENSAQVADIIEAAAAPVGSYRHKFKRRMTTINSFFGVTAGYEKYQTSDGDVETTFTGAYVPVGIHVAFPQNNWNWGAFVSILDLGTYAISRDDDTDITANVGFDQILSPGVFLTLAHKNTGPFTLGGGVSMGNKLVTDTRTDQTGNSLRVHAFIALDLTLFAF